MPYTRDKLTQLKDLLDQGLIAPEDYERHKQALLSAMVDTAATGSPPAPVPARGEPGPDSPSEAAPPSEVSEVSASSETASAASAPHASTYSAATEPADAPAEPEDAYTLGVVARVEELLVMGRKIGAFKHYKDALGTSLAVAKADVDAIEAGEGPPVSPYGMGPKATLAGVDPLGLVRADLELPEGMDSAAASMAVQEIVSAWRAPLHLRVLSADPWVAVVDLRPEGAWYYYATLGYRMSYGLKYSIADGSASVSTHLGVGLKVQWGIIFLASMVFWFVALPFWALLYLFVRFSVSKRVAIESRRMEKALRTYQQNKHRHASGQEG